MSDRTITRSIESDADPHAVLTVLADATMIPIWAPVFADTVEKDDQNEWRAVKGGRAFSLKVVVGEGCGTVDYLREIAPGKKGGAYIRVLPRANGGSVVVMTLALPPDTTPESVASVLREELERLKSLIELSSGPRSKPMNR
jgi:hypothetical protein